MAIAVRGARGRASSRHSDGELYGLVRHIATWVNRRRPTRVTMVEFDNARTGAHRPDAPSARAIAMRLGRDGRSMPWAELLERACAEGSIEIRHGKEESAGGAPHLSEAHLYFALNAVAKHLGVRTLTPAGYDRGREQLIEAEARRRTGRHPHQPHLLAELLPNSDQIRRIAAATAGDGVLRSGKPGRPSGAASWDHALRIAGLEPRATTRDRRLVESMPTPEALHHFVEHNDRWPTENELRDFAEKADFALTRSRSGPWRDQLILARDYRADLGLESPEIPEGDVPRRRRLTTINAPASIPGAPPRGGAGKGWVTREQCLDALQLFDEQLPPGEKRTRKRYAAFAIEHGLPSPTNFDRRYEGFTALMAEMRRRREIQ